MHDFHFLRPGWLLALPALFALLWTLRRQQRGGADWREYCDPSLLPHMLIGTPGKQTRRGLGLATLAGVLAVLALAGPAWERLPAPVFRNLSALVVVLDLSMSMNAADLKPSRLERARFKIEDILHTRKDGQTALVVYAGDAFAVTPVTDDSATIAAQLSALNPALMPSQGHRADLGLRSAERLLKQAGLKSGDVLLITSGDTGPEDAKAAGELRSEGYRVSVLGVGTPDGAPIPLPEGGFLKDGSGNILVPRLDASALARLADAGGGLSRALRPDSDDLDALLGFFDHRAESAEPTGDTVHIEQWREDGIFLLPVLLPLAALAFRRGWLGAWLLLVLIPAPEPAHALEWRDLWLTPDQQAQREFQAGHPDQAAQRFQNPEWKAAAEYKAGQYEQASKSLAKFATTDGQYNRGNALANQGQYEQAIRAYEQALKLDPDNRDAEYNKKLVEEALRKQEQQDKQDSQEKDQNQKQEQQQDRQDQGRQGQPKAGERGNEKPKDQDGKQANGQDEQRPEQKRQNGESGKPGPGEKSNSPDGQNSGSDSNGRDSQPQPAESEPKPAESKPGQEQQPGQDDPKQRIESEAKGEVQQAEEQWLRRIPDDPGGLLKRKFYYQYRQRQQQDSGREPW